MRYLVLAIIVAAGVCFVGTQGASAAPADGQAMLASSMTLRYRPSSIRARSARRSGISSSARQRYFQSPSYQPFIISRSGCRE